MNKFRGYAQENVYNFYILIFITSKNSKNSEKKLKLCFPQATNPVHLDRRVYQ